MRQVALWSVLKRIRPLRTLVQINVVASKQTLADSGAVGAEKRNTEMLDIIMLAIGLGFFALSIGYTMACDQL